MLVCRIVVFGGVFADVILGVVRVLMEKTVTKTNIMNLFFV